MILKIGSTDDLPKAAAAILESLDGRSWLSAAKWEPARRR